jgi:hypothetical protein
MASAQCRWLLLQLLLLLMLMLLTQCFPRRNTNVCGSGFLLGSVPSTTCDLFFLCKHQQPR